MKIQKNNLIIVVVIVILMTVYLGLDLKPQDQITDKSQTEQSNTAVSISDDQYKIMQAYQQQSSNIQVQGHGVVKAILPDDNDGSGHQKMILKLENGLTVLIAHNIDLAPRIEGLKKVILLSFMVNMNIAKRVVLSIGRTMIRVENILMDG